MTRGGPQSSWRSAVSSVTANSDGSYRLTGTQLSGPGAPARTIFPGAGELSDRMPEGRGSHVRYARSYNFSFVVPSKPGEVQTADFALPSGLAHGTYSLYLSSCGVSSAAAYSFAY